MKESHQRLPVDSIEYDRDNPRIKLALEKYGDRLDAERIYFALRSATEGEGATSSYDSLRGSVLAHGGAIFPIVVIARGAGFVCIDGNTRLAIYKKFQRENVPGDWHSINATVLTDAKQKDIEKFRISAHLVGAREWPAYEKARYLHYLRNEELMDYSEMIALCGGRKADIERQIDAFHDMNEFYRDVVDEDIKFQPDRFSGFVEVQKPQIKDAIFRAGFGMKDFGEWIAKSRIHRLADVRKLPRVLSDTEATDKFVNGGPRSIEHAARYLDQKEESERLVESTTMSVADASMRRLAKTLSDKIDNMPYASLRDLRDKQTDDAQSTLDELDGLAQRIRRLLEDTGS